MILPTWKLRPDPLDLAADQPGRRARMLGARVPGPAGQLGGEEGLAVGLIEGFRHGGIVDVEPSLAGWGKGARAVLAEVLDPDRGRGNLEEPILRPTPSPS